MVAQQWTFSETIIQIIKAEIKTFPKFSRSFDQISQHHHYEKKNTADICAFEMKLFSGIGVHGIPVCQILYRTKALFTLSTNVDIKV